MILISFWCSKDRVTSEPVVLYSAKDATEVREAKQSQSSWQSWPTKSVPLLHQGKQMSLER
jgi:hypothetical protein